MSGLLRTKVISAWDYRQGDLTSFVQPFETDRERLAAESREPTEESYREAVRRMTEEEGVKPEDLEDYTPAAYARQVCAEHYQNVLEEYAYQIIKEKLS